MTAEGKVKERGFPVALAWILFMVMVLLGAGFISSPSGSLQIIGFILLFAPLVVFSALMGMFYWRSRRYLQAVADYEEEEE